MKLISKYLLFIMFLSLIYGLWSYSLVKDMKALPSPILGSEYYYQLGQINYMYASHFLDWFKSHTGIGEKSGYVPLYSIIVTIFGKITGLSSIKALLYFNVLIIPISIIASFFLFNAFFKNEKIAFLSTLIFSSILIPPFVLKYTEFTRIFIYPIFLWSLYVLYNNQSLRNSLIAGVLGGVLALSHNLGFFVAIINFLILILYREREALSLITKDFDFSKLKDIFERERLFFLSLAIAFLLSQIYWLSWLLRFELIPKSFLWGFRDYRNPLIAIDTIIGFLNDLFLNFKSLGTIVFGSSLLTSTYYLIVKKTKLGKEVVFSSLIGVSLSILIFGSFISSMLFDFHLIPEYLFEDFFKIVMILILGYFVKLLPKKYLNYFMILVIIGVIHNFMVLDEEVKSSENYINAINITNETTKMFINAGEEIKKSTPPQAVILSNNPFSYMINSLTGRKVVVISRAPRDAILPSMNEREKDVAIIFYGNDTKKKLELLEKYNVDYLYFNFLWLDTEFPLFEITNPIDPLSMLYEEKYEEEMKKYNIRYIIDEYFLNPYVSKEGRRRFKAVLVTPNNYDLIGYGVWRRDLDKYLTPVFNESYGTLLKVEKEKIRKELG